MRVAVFGATGRTGMELVKQALAQGHEVTAFVRDAAKLGELAGQVTVVRGDVRQPDAVRMAVENQEALLLALGPKGLGPTTLLSEGTRNVVKAMQAAGVKRLVVLASSGQLKRHTLFERLVIRLVLRNVVADQTRQSVILQESGLDWIIVCPPMLTDGPFTGRYRVGVDVLPPGGRQIARADVAHFMLNQLADDQYLRSTPGIAL